MKFGLILATNIEDKNLNSFAPIGLGCIEAAIRKHLPEVEVVLRENPQELIAESPDLIGISASTEFYHIAIEWAGLFKQTLNVPVIIGGVHISLLPQSMTDDFDLAILGEGDETIIDVLSSIIKHKGIRFDKLKDIPGLFFQQDGQPFFSPPRSLIKNLDELPRINWDVLPYHHEHQAHIVSARGCPYKCAFCASEKFSRQYRYTSADRIIQEIEYFVVEKGLGGVTFFDDLLIANKKRLIELVEKLEQKDLLGKCRFHCQVRANLVNKEICELLKKLNIFRVGIGLESFSDKILRYYNKTGITRETNQQAIDLLSQYGFKVCPSIILGAPIETREDMLETLHAVYRNFSEEKIVSPFWGLLRPYPGTKIWEYAAAKGIVSVNMDWRKFMDWGAFELYLNEHLSAEEFKDLIAEWQTKIAINRFDFINDLDGNFLPTPIQSITTQYPQVKASVQKRKECGAEKEPEDDNILNGECINGSILLDGWYAKEPDGTQWLAKTARGIFQTGEKGKMLFHGFIPREVFKKCYNSELTIHFFHGTKKLLVFTLTEINLHEGSFFLDIPVQKNETIFLRIEAGKSFVPNTTLGTKDIRELSIVAKKLELH